MALRKLPLKGGINLDVNSESVAVAIVSAYNLYQDRADAWQVPPPVTLYADLGTGTYPVWAYDSPMHGVTLAVSAGRIFLQQHKNGTFTELTGADLSVNVRPTFTEDGFSILFAADSQINKYVPGESVVVPLGDYVAPEAETPIELGVYFDVVGDTGIKVIKMVSDQAKEIRYTIDGTTPTAASTLYTLPVVIATDTTLRAVAIANDDTVSDITTEKYIVIAGDASKPILLLFTPGDVHGNSVEIESMFGTDNIGVYGWCINELATGTATQPLLSDPGWVYEKPTSYTSLFVAAGTRTIVGWIRDKQGNICTAGSDHAVDFLAGVTVPDAFTFAEQTSLERGTIVQSEAITFKLLTFDTSISVTNGEYAVSSNAGKTWTNWRTADGTIKATDAVRVRLTTATTYETAKVLTLTVGGVDGTFTCTTRVSETPRNVTYLNYLRGTLMAIGLPAVGAGVEGDTHYSDDRTTNYSVWEVYNNESRPDDCYALIVDKERVYNLGQQSIEVTYYDGVTPFGVDRNSTQGIGTPAPGSVVYDNEKIYFLSVVAESRKLVILSFGGIPQDISFPLSVPIEQMESIADAHAFLVAFRGQNFYCLNFPTANATVADHYWDSIILAYHLQKKQWLILARWDVYQACWDVYRGGSFLYIEPWNLRLVGSRTDGKTYQLYADETIDYVGERGFSHRWRDDNSKTWSNARTVSMGTAGEYLRPGDQTQCGQYRNRQHEISYMDMTDAGEMFRAAILSGNINHQMDTTKRSNFYRYNVKCGTNEFIINTITEDITYLKR